MPKEKPADIYSGVRQLVEQKVARLAATPEPTAEELARRELEDGTKKDELYKEAEHRRLARLLDGHISRKVVKQTVMTSVYGVTVRGARDQIYNRLRDVYDEAESPPEGWERADLRKMANFVADLTLDSLDESFSGATSSMAWLVKVGQIANSAAELLCPVLPPPLPPTPLPPLPPLTDDLSPSPPRTPPTSFLPWLASAGRRARLARDSYARRVGDSPRLAGPPAVLPHQEATRAHRLP